METRQLRLVKSIVEEGSMAAAARRLYLTPGALSQQLKELEEKLGTAIFYRIKKRLVLTEAGVVVYAAAGDILKRLETAHLDVKKLVYAEEGNIRIMTECYTGYQWLPAVLQNFRKSFSNISVSISFETTHQPIQSLLKGEVDLVIAHTTHHEDVVDYYPLFEDELVAVISTENKLSRNRTLAPADIKELTLITHESNIKDSSIYKRVFVPEKVMPKNITIVPITEAAISLVKANVGVLVMPKWAIQHYLNIYPELTTLSIGRKGLFRQQYAMIRASAATPPYLQHFIEFLKQEIRI